MRDLLWLRFNVQTDYPIRIVILSERSESWQAYRTRKEPKIELATSYEYKEPGKYQIVVKVIDILGNDTTKTLELAVK